MLAFLIASFILVIVPNARMIYTLSIRSRSGRTAKIEAAPSCTTGIVPHVLVSLTGLLAILILMALLPWASDWWQANFSAR